jgi:lipoate-protein ligase A
MDAAFGRAPGPTWLDHGVREAQPAEEQDWNQTALDTPVTAPMLACWRYAMPGLVLGAAQHVTAELRARAAGRGIEITKRHSGGGAVLAGPWMLGVSVLLPPAHPMAQADMHAGFRRLGRAHCHALRQFGVVASLASDPDIRYSAARARAQDLDWACFGSVSHGEVLNSAGKKLAGFAQCKKRTGTLLVGGVLLGEPDWSLLCELFAKPVAVIDALRALTGCVEAGQHQVVQTAAFCAALSRAVRLQFLLDPGQEVVDQGPERRLARLGELVARTHHALVHPDEMRKI